VESDVFEPNIIWVAWTALSLVFFVAFLWAVVWTVRKLTSVSALERRVSDLERRVGERELVGSSPPES
jgi:hypothetical protein